METLGEYLKRVRETCGYSLEYVADVTKINLRYLEAIEHDDFSKTPGDIFYYGFVRSFAKCLGISEEEISRRIRETAAEAEPDVPNVKTPENYSKQDKVSKPGKARIILPVTAGIIVVIFLIIVFSGGRDSETIRNSKEVREAPADIPAEDISPQQPVAQKMAEPFELGIQARELTWINATIDDKETKDVILKPGEGVKWHGEGRIVITVGNAGGIDLEVNDKSVEPLGKRGAVVRNVVITSAGISM